MTGGLCIGDEWAGDPARGRRPWRDTMVTVTGPGARGARRRFRPHLAAHGPAAPAR